MSVGGPLLPLELTPRREPLEPQAAAALGPAALALAAHLLARPAEALHALRGVAGADVLAVLGAASDLPWIDGIAYFGRDERAPRLLLPTTVEIGPSPALLERALFARYPHLLAPVLVVPGARRVVPMATALPVEPARLRAYLEAP